jgi:CobQ-like glutamine amidotransferase family enzyme
MTKGADLTISHLYPDLLRTYGDRGNVLALRRRAEWRGFSVDVVSVSRGEAIPGWTNIVLIGGGTDRIQELIGGDLIAHRHELEKLIARGATVVGICGGYQLLGIQYTAADGTAIEGLGFLDVTTEAGAARIIGRVKGVAALGGRRFDLYGFENHGGRTTLGPRARPLASVGRGRGNNGRDRTEGAVQGTVIGTYLHGPVFR